MKIASTYTYYIDRLTIKDYYLTREREGSQTKESWWENVMKIAATYTYYIDQLTIREERAQSGKVKVYFCGWFLVISQSSNSPSSPG